MNKDWMKEDNFEEFEKSSDRRAARKLAKDMQWSAVLTCNSRIKKEVGYVTKQNINNPLLKTLRAEHFNDPIRDDTVQ